MKRKLRFFNNTGPCSPDGYSKRSTKIKIKEKWWPYIIFGILTFVLYGNTLNHSYVGDDAVYITENKFTQQGIRGIPGICSYDMNFGVLLSYNEGMTVDEFNAMMSAFANDGGNRRFRPLSYITFALEVEFFGKEITVPNSNNGKRFIGNAFVSHLNNILLYLLSACLLFLILSHLFPPDNDKKWYCTFPFIVVLLYLFHPVHTEVAANVKSRAEIMALLGSLGALWFTLKYADSNQKRNLVLSGICLFGAILSKENAATFLAIIPLTLYYFTDINRRKLFIALVPLLAALVVFFIIRTIILGWPQISDIYPDIMNEPFVFATKSDTIATIFVTLIQYVRLLLFPHPLTWDYSACYIEIAGWSNPLALFSLLFYLSIGMYAVYGLIKKKDVFSYAIWFYLIPLSVVCNLFYRMGTLMNERFIYFSSVGFAIGIGRLIYNYIPKSKRIAGIILIIMFGLYAAKTITRNRVWKDNFTLFTTDVKTSKNAAMANNHAGHACFLRAISPDTEDEARRKNEYCEKASFYLHNAIRIDTQYVAAHENLGYLYLYCNRDATQALHYFTKLYQLQSRRISTKVDFHVDAINMIPSLLAENKIISSPEALIQSLDELLDIRPDIGEAWYVRGVVYGQLLNNIDMALTNFEKALYMNFPKTDEFYVNMGVAYAKSGNYPNAIQYFLKAMESGSSAPIIYFNLGVIYQKLGDREKADFYIRKWKEMK